MGVQCEVTAKAVSQAPVTVFERYLTLWVFLCILLGIALGQFFPGVFQAIGAMALGMCAPLRVWAQVTWNRAAFEARSALEALRALGAQSASESRDILIDAPQIAENGALVPIDITSQLAGTRTISVIAEKNPFPLAARFEFRDGAVTSGAGIHAKPDEIGRAHV